MKNKLYLLLLLISACKNKPNVDRTAVQLNDSAVSLVTYHRDSLHYVQAIHLLDSAISIDSNYFSAYSNKLTFLMDLKEYQKALSLSQEMMNRSPGSASLYFVRGIIYSVTGDSISAKTHFTQSLNLYTVTLDTMKVGTRDYDMAVTSKAVTMKLAGQEEEGNRILKQQYERYKSDMYGEFIMMYLEKSPKELINDIANNRDHEQ